jgi:hypothetical protein
MRRFDGLVALVVVMTDCGGSSGTYGRESRVRIAHKRCDRRHDDGSGWCDRTDRGGWCSPVLLALLVSRATRSGGTPRWASPKGSRVRSRSTMCVRKEHP